MRLPADRPAAAAGGGTNDAPGALAVFAAALLVALGTRLSLPFDGLYGQDAFAYFNYARALWPHLRHGAPLPDLFWPVGYPVAVVPFLALTGGHPLAGQIVSALACAWGAAATFLLVRTVQRPHGEPAAASRAALAAGLAVALSGAVLRYSQVIMADALGMAAAATALLCAARFLERGHGPWLVGCAVALAWGTITRWLVGMLALPIGAALVLGLWGPAGQRAPRSRSWPWLLAAAVAALAVLVPGMLIAHAAPQSFEKHAWLQGWSLWNAFQRDFQTPDGHFGYRLPVALFYLVRLAWPDYFVPVWAPFVIGGGWMLLRQRRFRDACLLLGWPLVAWLFLSGIPYENPRFLVPTLPAVAALAGLGVAALDRAVSSRVGRTSSLVLGAAIIFGLVAGAREHASTVTKKNLDRNLIAWVSARTQRDATLLVSGPTLAFAYYGGVPVHDMFSLTPADLDGLVARGGPLFVVVKQSDLESQWVGLAPQRNFEALRRSPGLRSLGSFPPYTLFTVGP